jgi:uncharacterized protein YjbJ (UPF0337 family)
MNSNQINSRWAQLQSEAQESLGVFTDEDFLKAEGCPDKLYRILQDKVSDARAQLDKHHSSLRSLPCCGQ